MTVLIFGRPIAHSRIVPIRHQAVLILEMRAKCFDLWGLG
jgi:hypothetical protein